MANKKVGKFNWSLAGAVFGMVAAGALVVVFIVSVMLTSEHMTAAVKDVEELKAAIRDKKAVNCLISHEDEGEFTLQANDGFAKVKVVLHGSDGSKENMLSIRDDGTYYWNDVGDAFKLSDSATVDEMIAEISDGGENELDESYKLKCDSPSKSDFAVPEMNFVDFSGVE